jgi:hypothetical protein
MKKNYFAGLFLLLAFITMLIGCKKDRITSNEIAKSIEPLVSVSSLKTWYENQSNTASNLIGVDKSPNNGIPNWENTKYYKEDNTFVTPLEIKNQKTSHSFLVTETNNEGMITTAKYVYVMMDEEHLKIVPKSCYAADELNGKFILSGATGAIVVNDLKNNFISSTHFVNGNVVKEKADKIVVRADKVVTNNLKNNPAESNVSIDNEGEQNCIAWYWVTYNQYGEEISAVYLYTTCTNTGGGGSGSGGGGTTSPMNIVTKDVNWQVDGAVSGSWKVISYEKLTGVKDPALNLNSYFTNISHTNSATFNSVITQSGQPFTTWLELSANAQIISGVIINGTATISIGGRITFYNGIDDNISGSHGWNAFNTL